MKNIFLKETEQKSKLYRNLLTDKFFILEGKVTDVSECNREYHFIYVTNDETIKESDWCMSLCDDESYEEIYQCKDVELVDEEDKKIILTNDPSLIEDGVQQVNSSFLSFYAENTPDYVEVKRVRKEYVDDQDAYGYDVDYYSLIFSVEDLKTEKWVKHCSDKYEKWAERNSVDYSKMLSEFETLEGITSNMFDEKDWARFDRFVENREKENKKQIKTEEKCKGSFKDCFKPLNECACENIIDNWLEKNGNPKIAKQVEREAEELELQYYAEKRYPEDGSFMIMDIDIAEYRRFAFIEGAKWQAKRMYSEEEVFALLHKFNYDLVNSNIETFKEWFDEHKKQTK